MPPFFACGAFEIILDRHGIDQYFFGIMCGRFAQTDPVSALAEKFMVDDIVTDLPPSYNIAPGNIIAAVIIKDGRRLLAGLTWGIMPRWRKEATVVRLLINARAETVREKPTFRKAFEKGRCLIIASGFYEWMAQEKGKQPVFISLKNRDSFAMAGIFETGKTGEGDESASCVILTTGACYSLREVHNRMPVIVRKTEENLWLRQETPPETIDEIFLPYETEDVQWHRVSSLVNSPKNNSPQCLAPQ